MPITLAAPPQAVAELTENQIKAIAGAGNFRVEALSATKPEEIALSSGHPVYTLGLDDIVGGKAPAALVVSSWRFIVQASSAQPTAAETIGDGVSRAPAFSSVNSGPFVAGTINGFAAVSKDPAFATGDWEMRLLRAPALFIVAVWAHEKNGGADRIYPVAPAPAYLTAGKAYGWSDFLAAIKPVAEQRVKADDGLKG